MRDRGSASKRYRGFTVTMASVAAVATLAACSSASGSSGSSGSAGSSAPIVIGASIPLTGYPSGTLGTDCCGGVLAEGGGALWTVAGSGSRTLVRIDPRTNEATAALTFPQSIDVIAVGDGSVWVETGGLIDRLDPKAIP